MDSRWSHFTLVKSPLCLSMISIVILLMQEVCSQTDWEVKPIDRNDSLLDPLVLNWKFFDTGGANSIERIQWDYLSHSAISFEPVMIYSKATNSTSAFGNFTGRVLYIYGERSASMSLTDLHKEDAGMYQVTADVDGAPLGSSDVSIGRLSTLEANLSIDGNVDIVLPNETTWAANVRAPGMYQLTVTLLEEAYMNVTGMQDECSVIQGYSCSLDIEVPASGLVSTGIYIDYIYFDDVIVRTISSQVVGELTPFFFFIRTGVIAGVGKASGLLVALTVGLTEGLLQPWLNVWQLYPCGCHCAVLILWVPVAVYVALAAVDMAVVEFLVCQNNTDLGGPYITDSDQEVCRGLNFGLGGVAIAALLIFGAVAYVLWIQKGSSKTDNPDGSDTGGSYRKSLMILWITIILAVVIIVVAMVCLLVHPAFSEPDEPSFPAALIVKIIWIVYLLVYGLVIFLVAIYPFKKGKGHSVSDAGQNPGDLNKTRTSSPTATASEIDVVDHPKKREETTSFGGGGGIRV